MYFNILGYSALAPSLRSKSDWLLWVQGKKEMGIDFTDMPDVGFVPLNLRRHLDQNSKIAISAAYEAVRDYADAAPMDIMKQVRPVFASRWGEWGKTLNLLLDYIADGTISPLRFSYSVHNMPAAVLSISAGNHSSYCALAASSATFGMGLTETLAAFSYEPDRPALYIYSDEKTPELYKKAVPENIPCAAAFLISQEDSAGIRLKYTFRSFKPSLKDYSNNHVLNFIRFLVSGEAHLECDCFSVERV